MFEGEEGDGGFVVADGFGEGVGVAVGGTEAAVDGGWDGEGEGEGEHGTPVVGTTHRVDMVGSIAWGEVGHQVSVESSRPRPFGLMANGRGSSG